MAKNLQNSHFLPIFQRIKDSLKKSRTLKFKFYFHNLLANIVVHIQAKYWIDQIKTEGAYSIWRKGWWMDG